MRPEYCTKGFIHLTEWENLICYWKIYAVLIIIGIIIIFWNDKIIFKAPTFKK